MAEQGGRQLIHAAAVIYALSCVAVFVFQVCLVAGVPFGRLTQGGSHPAARPGSNRVVAGLSIVLLLLITGSVLSAAVTGHTGLDGWVGLP